MTKENEPGQQAPTNEVGKPAALTAEFDVEIRIIHHSVRVTREAYGLSLTCGERSACTS
jgi:hypothetical protein